MSWRRSYSISKIEDRKPQVNNLEIVNRFSWHKDGGNFAERWFRANYFRNLDLKFRKIRKDKKEKKPEGYILDKNNKKIALAEIKCITYKERGLPKWIIRAIIKFLNKKIEGRGIFTIILRKYLPKQINEKEFKKCLSNRIIQNDEIKVGDYFVIKLNKIKTHRKWEYGGGITPTQLIKIDETIKRTIRYGKKQLRKIKTNIPKILYLIGDDTFFKPEVVRTAIFGKWKTIENSVRGIIFNNYSGFHPRYKNDNKMYDNFLSAIICFKLTQTAYKLWIYINKNAPSLPDKLLDIKNCKERWDYDNGNLKNWHEILRRKP